MGTDIHGGMFYRYRGDKGWRLKSEVPSDRNYTLFAALAGVRNGHGFAGVETFEPLVPIAEDRGLPERFFSHAGIDSNGIEKLKPLNPDNFDFGDHSMTHITLEELVEWPGWDKDLSDSGLLDRGEYEKWQAELKTDPTATPGSYCGDAWGQDIIKTTEAELLAGTAPKNWTYIRCRWKSPMREECATFLKWLDWIKTEAHYELYKGKQQEAFTEYLLVIGFDS
jgi:hypothetical protein